MARRRGEKATPVAKAGDAELATWLRTELTARRKARGSDPTPPPTPPSGTKKPAWLKFEGLGGGFAFVHGAGPLMEAVGKTLDWAQEILVQALLGNVPWSVVGAFLKFVLLPSGRRVEDYVTDAEFEELRVSLHTLRAKKSARRPAAKKPAKKTAAKKVAAPKAPARKSAPKPIAKRPPRPREPSRPKASTRSKRGA